MINYKIPKLIYIIIIIIINLVVASKIINTALWLIRDNCLSLRSRTEMGKDERRFIFDLYVIILNILVEVSSKI